MKKQSFKEFFDMKTPVLTDPPKGGVQGVVMKKDSDGKSINSPEKHSLPRKTVVSKKGHPKKIKSRLKQIGENKIRYYVEDEEENKPMDDQPEDQMDDQQDDMAGEDTSQTDAKDDLDQDVEDPNSKVIRTVKGAHLVFKRATDEGSYEELWIYPIKDMKSDMKVRKAILAGTDIEDGKMQSEDGVQKYSLWTAGNAQMVHIEGLPN